MNVSVKTVFGVRMIKWNVRKVAISGKLAHLRRYVQGMFESGYRTARELAQTTGKDINQWILIVDFIGYTLRQHACAACKYFNF